jgi:hypothetical protein
VVYVVGDDAVDGGQGAAELERGGRLVGGADEGPEEPGVDLVVEDADSDAVCCEHVGVGAGNAFDERLEGSRRRS